MKLSQLLTCAPILILAACTSNPKWANTQNPQRTVAQAYDQQAADKCAQDIKAAAGDTQKMLSVRLGCSTYLSEVFQGKVNKSTGAVRVQIGYIDYSNFTDDGYAAYKTPELTVAQVAQYMGAIRAQLPKSVIPLANGDKVESAYGSLTIIDRTGKRVNLSSVEYYLSHILEYEYAVYGEPDANGEVPIDQFFFDSATLNWVYNSAIGYTETTSMPGAKYSDSQSLIKIWNGTALKPLTSITQIVPEAQLVGALKNDMIIRNSDVWDKVKNTTTLNEFVAQFPKGEYTDHRFLSYSTRLNKADQIKAKNCGSNVGKPGLAPDQAGIRCLRKNKVILYEYSLDKRTFQTGFTILESDRTHLRIKSPFTGLGDPILRYDVPVNQNSYVHYISAGAFLGGEAQRYSQNRCRVKMDYDELIEASSPPLMNYPSCQ
ncbi:MAG: hypothetical protein K2P92_08780 [Bdellovibrionaceae bacterium]|nr:hypothetical protein [Pseudobdellovibrionaceae bacterium]